MNYANIEWRDEIPWSHEFEDPYFSAAGGLEESLHVFVRGNDLPHAWQGQKQFLIGETGFGTGLNFLLTVREWLATAPPDGRLYYYAVEAFPMSPQDLQRAYQHYPELIPLLDELLPVYPPPVQGWHSRWLYDGRISLNLLLETVDTALSWLSEPMDVWYLDGFAPSRNPDMWQESVLQQLARLSHGRTRASTYTVAGAVRRGLEAVGYSTEKMPGFGRKRDMLAARKLTPQQEVRDRTPWYRLPAAAPAARQVVVLGAGIAGVTTAWSLARRGWQVSLVDQHNGIASEASGNPAGIIMPRISLAPSGDVSFYLNAYLYTLSVLAQRQDVADYWHPQGVVQLVQNASRRKKWQGIEAIPGLMASLDAQQASDICGFPLTDPALYFSGGGWLEPGRLCRSLLDEAGDRVRWLASASVESMAHLDGQWQLLNGDEVLAAAPALVLAAGIGSPRFDLSRWLNLRCARGQISYLQADQQSEGLRTVLCHDGYLLPPAAAQHIAGASFVIDDCDSELRQVEHEYNLHKLAEALPAGDWRAAKLQGGRAAVRAVTPDRMPLIGPLPDVAYYEQHYHDLHRGRPAEKYPPARYHAGLYVNTGHGARGLTSSLLCADILARQMNNEPQAIDAKQLNLLHPARFLIRKCLRPEKI